MEQTEQNETLPERPSSIDWQQSSIDWQIESSESKTTQVSPDGRWLLNTKVQRDGKRQMHLVNYDILDSPMGSGENQAECWRKFIKSCVEYARKLDEICAEAAIILANLENNPTNNGTYKKPW